MLRKAKREVTNFCIWSAAQFDLKVLDMVGSGAKVEDIES